MDTVTSIRMRLQTFRGQWPAICQATGLTYDWMCKFAQGRIVDPGMSKLEKLATHLDVLDAEAEAKQKVA